MPDPIFPGKPGLYVSMLHYGITHNADFAKEHHLFFSNLLNYVGDVSGKDILDVGCGKSFWLTLLLHNNGANVTGIDTEVVQPGFSLNKYLNIFKKNGLERAVRTFIWEQVFARPYYKKLEAIYGKSLNFDGISLLPISNSKIDFPENSFDLVVSHEVFEHIKDISSILDELKRVMKPDAMTYIYIHNYTSLSGGHHIAWKYPDTEPSAKVPPWDHLRDNEYPDIPSWLNKMRENEYREEFEKKFDIIDWISTEKEGIDLLSKPLRQELKNYSEKELLTKGFIVVAKPKP